MTRTLECIVYIRLRSSVLGLGLGIWSGFWEVDMGGNRDQLLIFNLWGVLGKKRIGRYPYSFGIFTLSLILVLLVCEDYTFLRAVHSSIRCPAVSIPV